MQKWFAETGIPLTEHTRDDALRERRDLLDKLADAQRKQADAKAKRDANPNRLERAERLRARHVRNARRREGHRAVQRQVRQDIERYASKLIDQYKAERESHERPLSEARNRVENCKKVDDMSY